MDEVLVWAREFGWTAATLLLLLLNAGKIGHWLEGMLGKIWPDIAAARAAKLERRDRAQRSQLEQACLLYEELISVIRGELEDERQERKAAQTRTRELILQYERQTAAVVERYERHVAVSVEVLHDMSDAMREHSQRLSQIEVSLSSMVGQKT